jgi:hypothetical protein
LGYRAQQHLLLGTHHTDSVFLLHLGKLGLLLLALHLDLLLLLELFLSILAAEHLGLDDCKLTLVLIFVSARELL